MTKETGERYALFRAGMTDETNAVGEAGLTNVVREFAAWKVGFTSGVRIGRAEALEEAARVLDAYREYDTHLCCDGRECACGGATVHETIQHYIRALITKPNDSEE